MFSTGKDKLRQRAKTVTRTYTVNRFRPLARRLLSTCRPQRVDILARKPWVLFRFTFETVVKFFFIFFSH